MTFGVILTVVGIFRTFLTRNSVKKQRQDLTDEGVSAQKKNGFRLVFCYDQISEKPLKVHEYNFRKIEFCNEINLNRLDLCMYRFNQNKPSRV